LKTDDTAAVRFNNQPSPNLFVAGEMMAGNVLGKGYTAGVGMTIGTAFGRIAGQQAARAALDISDSVPRLAEQVMQNTADRDTRVAA
jgi:tricarballylate dehydrogenase